MSKRATLTIDRAMPGHDVKVQVEQPKRSSKPKQRPEPKDLPRAEDDHFVDIGTLWEQYWDATRRGWHDKAKALAETIDDRAWAEKQKERAVMQLAFEANQHQSKLPVFVILVARNQQFRLEHLHAGLAIMDLLEAQGPGSQMGQVLDQSAGSDGGLRIRATKGARPGNDGGMARNADDVRFNARVWSEFVETAESEGLRLSSKPRFGDVCADVIRSDSTLVEACKAHIRMRQVRAREVAVTAMVAGLDAIIPMFAHRK